MTILVDEIRTYGRKGPWCHMVSDESLEELHQMADRIGLRREWFQDVPSGPHYDLRPSKRRLAVNFGAEEVDTVQLTRRLVRS